MHWQHIVRAGAAGSAGLGLLALLAWLTKTPTLATFGSGLIPMAPSTALLFTTFGIAIWIASRSSDRRAARRTVVLIAGSCLAVATLLLVLSSAGMYSPVEHLGFACEDEVAGAPVGHMSPVTASCFVLAAAALLALAISAAGGKWSAGLAVILSTLLTLAGVALVLAYLFGAPLLYGGRFIPPALPTSLAFLLLGIALLAQSLHGVEAHHAAIGAEGAQAGYTLATVLALAAGGIVATGWLYFRGQEMAFRAKVEHELAAIADLKVGELTQWRRERMGDASVFMGNANFSNLVRRFLEDPSDRDAQRRLQTWLENVRDAYNYERVSLLDVQGREAVSAPATESAPSPWHARGVAQALRAGKPMFLDFHRDAPGGDIHLTVLAPILDVENDSRGLGALAFRIDPNRYLYPLINRWPVASATAETLLVRKEENEVLFLNELRFRKGTALNLRFGLDGHLARPAVQAVLGKKGIVDSLDYRGVPVIAYVRPVPDSPWSLVARMDRAEVYAPLRKQLWLVTGLIAALLAGAGAGVALVWRQHALRHYQERLAASESLRASEARYRRILDGLMEGFQVIGRDWRYLYVNDAAAAHGRRAKEELVGRAVLECYPGFDRTPAFAAMRRSMEEGKSQYVESAFTYPDGSSAWFEIGINPVPEGIAVLSVDRTDRKQAEERIMHLNRVLRAIRDVNQLIVREKDRDLLIRRACDLLVAHRGYASALLLLTDAQDRPTQYAEAGLEEGREALEEIIRRGELPPCCVGARQAGGVLVVAGKDGVCASCPLHGTYGEKNAMCAALVHDGVLFGYVIAAMTEGASADAEEQDLFAEMAGDLAYALHTLSVHDERDRSEHERKTIEAQFLQAQKMEAVGRLAGGVAHDFNNMLMAITGYCQMIRMDLKEDDPLVRDIKQIEACADRAATLTRQLLAFSRKQVLEPRNINLNDTVADIEKMLRRLIGEDIDLVTPLAPDLGTVRVDPGQVEQIIMNLAVNARDAMPQGGKLTLVTANVALDKDYAVSHPEVTPGEYVMLAVSDTGHGMDEQTLSRIFEPFFTTKEKGKGTGLGLATVYGIVKQSGGHIWVYSEPGRGATFKVYFPRVREAAEKVAPRKAPLARAHGQETVLVVEDNEILRPLIVRVLQGAGYTVLPASNGGEALLLCERNAGPVHLVLTDVVMPQMGGRELVQRLARLHPEMRAIYMSGYTDNAVVHHGVLDSGTAFLQKPFGYDALLAKVREVLDKKEPERDA